MLSAFTARPIIELKQRDKSKIETILSHGDRVLVGLNSGALRIYRVNDISSTSTPTVKPSDLLREVDKFSTRAIEQLAIIKEANTIVSLSNYCVSLHDLQTYQQIETLVRTKNASSFAVTSSIARDASTGVPEIISRLAVAVKRRLLLWSWHESELSDDVGEVVLAESIRSITWASATTLVCGMNAGYVLVDAVTKEVSEISAPGANGSGNDGNGGGIISSQASRFGAVSSVGMGYMGLGGYMPKPLATKLMDGEILLAKDIHTLFITEDGKPKDKRQIPWQAAPESIGYSYPYVLALQPPAKGSLEVRNPDTLSLLQSISLPGAAQLHLPPPTVSLTHAAKGFHVSSERCVWKMDARDYDSQVAELVEGRRYDEAISVLGMLEDALLKDKTGSLREIKMLKAEALFREKRFRDSMDLFNEDEVQAPPERVLKLFPPLISGELSLWHTDAEGTTASESGEDGEEQTPPQEDGETSAPETGKPAEKPKNIGDTSKAKSDDNSSSSIAAAAAAAAAAVEPSSSPAKSGGVGFAKLLMGHRKPVNSDAASITSTKKGDHSEKDDAGTDAKGSRSAASKTERPLEGKELTNAVLELNSYLVGTRTRLQRVIDPSTGKLRPQTTTPPPPMPSSTADNNKNNNNTKDDAADVTKHLLLSLGLPSETPSSKDPESEAARHEEALRATFRLVDTTLFRAYMFSRPTLAGSLFRIPNFCDPAVVNEKLLENDRYNELVDFFHGKGMHQQALELLRRFGTGAAPPAGLQGPNRTVLYLQSLPPTELELILEHSAWTLQADPALAMEVFLGDTENAETLPRDRVVAFLGATDEALEVRYLEHIINELGDATPDFHNRLVELFVRRLLLLGRGTESAEGNTKGGEEEEEAWKGVMRRFVGLLRESKQYSLSRAFSLIPREDERFYEAQAVVLSNMGQDRQALEIYVFKMKDFAKAEEYCNRVHVQEESSTSTEPHPARRDSIAQTTAEKDDDDLDGSAPSIYHTLLSLYLTPPPPHSVNLGPALALVSKHGSRLPPTSTLSLIPDTLPVRELESYFRGRIRSTNSIVAESRVVAGLAAAELVAMRARLHLGEGVAGAQTGRSRRVVVSDERLCGVCHKRLGGSVVSVMPDNSVVHYACANKAVATAAAGTQQGFVGRPRLSSWRRMS